MLPATDPTAKDWGNQAGRTHRIAGIQRRIEAIVDQAPELTEAQAERLTRILSGALDRVTETRGMQVTA